MSYPTWSDLNKESIVPPLGARQAPDLGPVALMISTELDCRTLRSSMEPKKTVSFFVSSLSTDAQGIAAAGPFIGAPYGVMLLESLKAKGAEQVIVLGWCGALTGDLDTGDLIVPDRAFVDEGTSRHYAKLDADMPETSPDPALSRQLAEFLDQRGIDAHRRTIWTTDAIYRETEDKVNWYRERGAAAVEMECSALFAAAVFRNIPVAALLVVSDSVASRDWDPGFRKDRFKTARRTACQAVLDFGRSLAVTDAKLTLL